MTELYLDTVGEIALELFVRAFPELSMERAFLEAREFMETAEEKGHASPLWVDDDGKDRG